MKKTIMLAGAFVLLPVAGLAADSVSFVVDETKFVRMWSQIGLCFLVIVAILPLCIWRNWHVLIAEIIAGILLGPTVFGRFFPAAYAVVFPRDTLQSALIETFSHIGIVFMLFETGMKIKPAAAIRRGRAAMWIGAGGVLIPLILGSLATVGFIKLTGYKPAGAVYIYSIFMGCVIAVSALPIIVRLLEEFGQRVTEFGQTVICGYAINDIIAWLVFGVVFQAVSGVPVTVGGTVIRFILAIAGTVLLLLYGPKQVERLLELVRRRYGSKWAVRAVLVVAIVCGLTTAYFSLTFYYGIFLAGILVSDSEVLSAEIRRRMTDMTQDIMVPIYFASIGLSADFGRDFNLPLVLFITAASIGLKYVGAWISAIPSGRDRREWQAIAVSFTPSGINGIIFSGMALGFNLIGQQDHVAIVISALVSTIVAGPWLRRAIETSFPKGHERMSSLVVRFPRLLGRYEAQGREQALRLIAGPVAQVLTEHGNTSRVKDVVAAIEEVAKGGYEILETATAPNIAFLHFARDDISEPILMFYYSGKRIPWLAECSIRLTVVFVIPKNYQNLSMRDRLARLFLSLCESKLLEGEDSSDAKRKEVEEALELAICTADGDKADAVSA